MDFIQYFLKYFIVIILLSNCSVNTKSPWIYHDNFENNNLTNYKFTNKQGSIKRSLYKIVKEKNGNHFLKITVKKNINVDKAVVIGKKDSNTERAELSLPGKNAINKIVWFGFRFRIPKDFKFTKNRLLISQFKHQFKNMKKGPLLGIRFYDNGQRLNIGGLIGGTAYRGWSEKEANLYSKTIIYEKYWDGEWYPRLKYNSKNVKIPRPVLLKIDKNVWTTFKIGLYTTRSENGFVKVYQDNNLIYEYNGPTFKWTGSYLETVARIGPYRHSCTKNYECFDQTLHYDDYTLANTKRELDDILK